MYSSDLQTNAEPALVAAVDWLRGVLLGSVATSVAVVAIAAVGLLMLNGRVPLRRGLSVILGCFVLFSATTIAGGLLFTGPSRGDIILPPPQATQPAYTPAVPRPQAYDPYAGASMPVRDTRPIIQ
jgi:type IV secretory pathway VirB2 component (pilin)